MDIDTDSNFGTEAGREAIQERVAVTGDIDPEVEAYAKHGSWRDAALPADAASTVREIAQTVRVAPKKCYRNARNFVAVADRDDIRYVEGIAVPEIVPLPTKHAWVEIDGAVAEITWGDSVAAGTGAAYYGVEVELDTVMQTLGDRGVEGPVVLEDKESS